MAGKGGGAWKVAYADFVTAMMAFFLVMWIVAQNKSVKEAVSGYFRDPFGSDDKPAGSGHKSGYVPRSKTKTDGVKGGTGAGEGPAPRFEVIRDQHGTSIGADVLFAEASTELDVAAKQRLDELVPLIRGKQNRIEIRAHTARRPIVYGEKPLDDWKICYDRSVNVMRYLESKGVESWRLRLGLAGPNEPAADASNELWRVRNSRVELIMMDEYFDDREREAAEKGGDAGHDEHGEHGNKLTSGHAKQADHGDGGHGKDAHGHGKAAQAKSAHGKDSGHGKPKKPGKNEAHAKDSHGKDAHADDSHGDDAHGKPGDHGHATEQKPHAADEHGTDAPGADGHGSDGHATDPHAGDAPSAKPGATPSTTKPAEKFGTVLQTKPNGSASGTGPQGSKPVRRLPVKGLVVPPTPAGGAH
jgi:chemotaxis protein MotB